MTNTAQTAALTTDTRDEAIVVIDPAGGVWWPGADAAAEIAAAPRPDAAALAICESDPTRGEWRA